MGWTRISIADPIKWTIGAAFPPAMSKEDRRSTYVAYGKAMRKWDDNFFLRIAKSRIDDLDDREDICIPDVRYLNEAEYVLSKGGFIAFIDRPKVKPANKEEEQTIAEIVGEFGQTDRMMLLKNDAGKQELRQMMVQAVTQHYGTFRRQAGFGTV